jgi:uncharacterized protein
MSLRVVFDTNVLISAAMWAGTPEKCVDLVRTRLIVGLTCAEILDELADKLSIKFNLDDAEIGAVLGSLLILFEIAPITGAISGTQPDPKDDKIIECAFAGNATHIVSGNLKHLVSLGSYRGIEIVTPAELMRIAQSGTN